MVNIPIGWKELQLGEVLDYDQPNEYIVESEILEEETSIPVLTANKSFIKGYTNETKGIYENVPVIIFDDFTADNKFVNFPFKVKSSAMKILKLKYNKANLKFIFYQMQLIDVNTTTHKRYYISLYQNLPFIFPTDEQGKIDLEKQQQIVDEIEKQFTRLDASVKDLKSVKDNLEVYRKSVLKNAFKGKSKNITSDFETWNNNSFSDIFKNVSPTNKIKKSDYLREGNLPVIDQGDGLIAGYIVDNSLKQEVELPVIIFGDHTRRFKFVDFNFVAGADGIKILKINKRLLPKFAYYQCLTLNFPNKGYSRHFQYVNKTNLVFPESKEIQQQIVEEIESHFSVIDKLQEVIESSLNKTELLRKSILKNAFEGKLVKEPLDNLA